MDLEQTTQIYSELRTVLNTIRRVENHLNPKTIHALANLYKHKGALLERIVEDPPAVGVFDQEEGNENVLDQEIEDLRKEITSMREQLNAKG